MLEQCCQVLCVDMSHRNVTSISHQSVANSFTRVGSDICKISTKKSIFLGGVHNTGKERKSANSAAPAPHQRHCSATTALLQRRSKWEWCLSKFRKTRTKKSKFCGGSATQEMRDSLEKARLQRLQRSCSSATAPLQRCYNAATAPLQRRCN